MTHDSPPAAPSLRRLSGAEFATLFSGEDACGPPARTRGGVMRAAAALFVDSARALSASTQLRGGPQAFARRAT